MTGAFSGDKMEIRTQKAWAERGRRQLTRENAMKYIKAQSPEAFLLKAKKRGFVCPKCGNGTGSDGDGIVKNPRTAAITASSAVKSVGTYLTL